MQRDGFTPSCRLPLLLCNEDGLSLLIRLLLPFLAARDSPLLICLLLPNHMARRAYLSSLVFCYLQQRGFYPSESLLVVECLIFVVVLLPGSGLDPRSRLGYNIVFTSYLLKQSRSCSFVFINKHSK